MEKDFSERAGEMLNISDKKNSNVIFIANLLKEGFNDTANLMVKQMNGYYVNPNHLADVMERDRKYGKLR